jgi:hypothetical protein
MTDNGTYRWDWINDPKLPHGGTYVVKRPNGTILCQIGPLKRHYDEAMAVASAMNDRYGYDR